MVKSKEAQIKEIKQEATVKVKTILYVLLIVAVFIGGVVVGWMQRSDFSNEVRGEVKTQMSAVQAVESVSKTKN